MVSRKPFSHVGVAVAEKSIASIELHMKADQEMELISESESVDSTRCWVMSTDVDAATPRKAKGWIRWRSGRSTTSCALASDPNWSATSSDTTGDDAVAVACLQS